MTQFVIRRVLARNWLWLAAFVIMGVGIGLMFLSLGTFKDMHPLKALALAATVSVVISLFLLRSVYFCVVRINGGPFKTGDIVHILTGPHRGRTTVVYEEWKERGQVRVDLGDEAQRKVEDVFSNIKLVKGKKALRNTRQPPVKF